MPLPVSQSHKFILSTKAKKPFPQLKLCLGLESYDMEKGHDPLLLPFLIVHFSLPIQLTASGSLGAGEKGEERKGQV